MSDITHQVAHKREVCYGEKGGQYVEPHAVQRRHVDHHEVNVDGADAQDHQPSSDFVRPAQR